MHTAEDILHEFKKHESKQMASKMQSVTTQTCRSMERFPHSLALQAD
jgi:hypothetical protein